MNLSVIINSFEFQTILKIFLGAILTGAIGLERSSLNKPAGFGTHALIGISSVLVVVASEYLALYYDIDMSRIPAQLLSGIGFIGAGTILQNGVNVKGVTTAAGILATTCIGLCIGAGYYLGGIVATIIVFLILSYAHNISDCFERYSPINLKIVIKRSSKNIVEDNINKYLNSNKIDIKKYSRSEGDTSTFEVLEINGSYDGRFLKKNKIVEDLFKIDGIKEIEEY